MDFLSKPIEQFYEFLRLSIEGMGLGAEWSYGLAIVILTLIIKILLLPLAIKQIKSMNKTQEIQPLVKKLQEKYKNDPQKLNQETMKLYKEHNANPMASCLPMFIQMPILFAMFAVLRDIQGIEGIGFVPLFWIKDLSAADPYFVLPVLSAGLTFLSMKISSQGTGNNQMASMNIFMTVFILWVSIKFSSALLIYWVSSNIIQLIQTLALKNLKKTEPASN